MMQGWDRSWFVTPQDREWWTKIPGVNGNPHKFIDFITNMSGNAFSVFHSVPLTLCMMATMGKFTVVRSKNTPISEVVDDEEDGDEGAADAIGELGGALSVSSSESESP